MPHLKQGAQLEFILVSVIFASARSSVTCPAEDRGWCIRLQPYTTEQKSPQNALHTVGRSPLPSADNASRSRDLFPADSSFAVRSLTLMLTRCILACSQGLLQVRLHSRLAYVDPAACVILRSLRRSICIARRVIDVDVVSSCPA